MSDTKGAEHGVLLLIVLVILLVGAAPSWPYSRNWGYGPSGIVGLLLVILLVLLLLQMVPFGFSTGSTVTTVP